MEQGASRRPLLLVAALGEPRVGSADCRLDPPGAQAQTDAMAKGIPTSAPWSAARRLPHHPFDPAAPAGSRAGVPVIISTTLEDAALRLTNFDLDEAGLRGVIARLNPDKADAITRMYLDANLEKPPFLSQAQASSLLDATARKNAIIQGERRAALGARRTSMYIWACGDAGVRRQVRRRCTATTSTLRSTSSARTWSARAAPRAP